MTANLERFEDWRSRFSAECDRIWSTPFQYGVHDCGPGLAGNLVLAITGIDLVSEYRGTYHDKDSAVAIMRNCGFENLGDMVASFLPEYDHPSMARIGDIVAIETSSEFGHALGVLNGERALVLTAKGVGTVDRCKAARAFKVG